MIGIFGAGFGLYGYLPALIEAGGGPILLLDRYRTSFSERVELRRFVSAVQWKENEESVLRCASTLVIATAPTAQTKLVPQCLAQSNIEILLLEKPLAPSPEIAIDLFEGLLGSRKIFRIGYTFRYTDWGQQLLNSLRSHGDSGTLIIGWRFMAHHFRHNLRNWKRFGTTGGGAIRFYGVHLIALLAELGYRNVQLSRAFGASPDEVEKWTATFEGLNLPMCEVIVDTRSSVQEFKIETSPSPSSLYLSAAMTKLSDPFELQSKASSSYQVDSRFPALLKLCSSLWSPTTNEYEWYEASLRLWHEVEKRTQFEITAENI